ncbi:MAG: YjgN family protein [Gammaproteobacteria bacterium]|jgi:uncharacterized membrane protein YjgN (DUF898 family)
MTEWASASYVTEVTESAPEQEMSLEFRGSASEYFRIWIVNLCLTLLTFGVFSAWAKVRKKRYFYSNITVDKTPFQYLAEPLPILKGRIVAALLFGVYWFSSSFYLPALPWVLAAGLFVAPWVLSRSAAFNARYSAFRNMPFQFRGNYLGAAQTLYWLGLVPLLVLGSMFEWWGSWKAAAFAFLAFGALFPWWISRLKHYMVAYTRYGGASGRYAARGGQFFRVYFVAGLIMVAAGIVTSLVMFKLIPDSLASDWSMVIVSVPSYLGYMLAYAYIQANTSNLVWNQSRLGPLGFRSTLTGAGMAKLYFTNAAGILASLGLLIPWAVVRTLRYRTDNLSVLVEGDLAELQGGEASAVQAAGAEMGEMFDMDIAL